MKSIRLLIVDDFPQVRLGLTTMLKLAAKNLVPCIEVIGEAQNGLDAIQLSKTLRPDAILMDLEMPVLNGYLATQTIKAVQPSTYIIILTIHADSHTRQMAAQAGADAFVEKSAPPEELIRAIQGMKKSDYSEDL